MSGTLVSSNESYLYGDYTSDFYGYLIIPKVDFRMEFYDINSSLNNVDSNIELLEESKIEDNVYFFAGHSGRGDNCYFNRVDELDVGDSVYVILRDNIYMYEVSDKYKIIKSGYMEINNDLRDVLFLITCSGYNLQLIVKAVLIN